ncbi:MAG: N-acetylgalactosamine-6-sulfatase, partial [Planctomycetes bacterium]|nr:N-acetylgalactosamine-6-sulfatase [Planctomycetota bacterium]
ALAGTHPPNDRIIDGFDQTALITGRSPKNPRTTFYYHIRGELHAVRHGKWKLMLPNRTRFYTYTGDAKVTETELYDLDKDISEKNNVASQYPQIVDELMNLAKKAPNSPDPIKKKKPPKQKAAAD